MSGRLGEKIGEGAAADIHVWAPGKIVKLFRPGALRSIVRHEARTIRAVFAAGLPVPELFDEVTLGKRFGIVLQRLDGPTLLHLLHTGEIARDEAGAILATLYRAVHRTPAPAGTPSLRTWIEAASGPDVGIPRHIATRVLARIDRLQPEDGLCHGDLHPNNVLMTSDGPKIIDWSLAMRAPAAADLARCHVLHADLAHAPDDLDPEPLRMVHDNMRSEYARLAGLSPAALDATTRSYLPILRAFTIGIGASTPARREQLTRLIEADLED